jgi:hypothetical protein
LKTKFFPENSFAESSACASLKYRHKPTKKAWSLENREENQN